MEMDQIEFVRHQASEASKALYAHPEYWPALLNTPPTQCQSITQIDLPISIESILDCHLSRCSSVIVCIIMDELTNVFLSFLWARINIRRQFGCVIRIPKLMACLLVCNVVDSWA